MDRFEYRLGGFTGSIPELEKKLNELGSKGWDIISTPRKLYEISEFDSQGNILCRWEIFMKLKIQKDNKEQT